MKTLRPKVTVLLSVFNTERFLGEAMESILAQTYDDFEFLIINDGSSDNSTEILLSYDDPRLRVHHQENMGLVKSLNRGYAMARGEFIARMDADDIRRRDRLERQVRVMEQNEKLLLTGSFYEVIDDTGRILKKRRLPTEPVYRLWRLRFHSTFAHGSVMFRKREILEAGGYSEKRVHVEDYDLWLRISSLENTFMIPTPLYRYRVFEGSGQLSARYHSLQTGETAALSDFYLLQVNPALTEDLRSELRSLYWGRGRIDLSRRGVRALQATIQGFRMRFGLSAEDGDRLTARVGLDALWAATRNVAGGGEVGPVFEILREFGARLPGGVIQSYPDILRKALRLY